MGDNLPTEREIEDLKSEIAAVLRKARKFGIVLDPDERIRLIRARKGADHVVERVHELAVKYNVDLPGIPLQGMQDDLALVRMLRPVHTALKDVLTVIDDTEGQAESESWDAFLAYYATLSGMATRIPTLAAELKDVQTFSIRCMSPVLPLPAGWVQIRGHDGDENDGNDLGKTGRGVARER